VQCHSGGTGLAGVNLDSYDNIMAGGDSGALVVACDSSMGTLIPQMEEPHPNNSDHSAFIPTLEQWIDQGALNN
jgi:hypothetical protein